MIDVNSETWKTVVENAERAIEFLTQKLKKDQDEISTTRTRERIRAFEDVLLWAKPKEELTIEESAPWLI